MTSFLAALVVHGSLLLGLAPGLQARIAWAEAKPQDREAKVSATHPEADIEILRFYHVIRSSGPDHDWQDSYVQAKIYTLQGVQQHSLLRFSFDRSEPLSDVEARVVKPDGRVIELKKDAFVESTGRKSRKSEERWLSLAFPNLEPGDIVDFRVTRRVRGNLMIQCQQAAPVREFSFDLKECSRDYNLTWFQLAKVEPKRQGNGVAIKLTNLAPFVEEELSPPDSDLRGWIYVVFSDPFLRYYSNDDVWNLIGEYLAEDFHLSLRGNSELKAKVAELTAGAATDEEKLARLYEYCQSEITNLRWIKNDTTMEALEKREKKEHEVQTARTTMSRKSGMPDDISYLFGSLAKAAGYEVRLAISADRGNTMRLQHPKGWLFADRRSVAVKLGDTWRFYSPGEFCVPAGMLSPKDEGATMFVCDQKKSWYASAPEASPDQSTIRRKGRFTLDEEGNLEGTVEEQANGHPGIAIKERWWGEPQEDSDKQLRENIAERLPTAEVSDIQWENLHNRAYPVTVRYKVRVPGFASQVGSRLLVVPNYFEMGAKPVFAAETRTYPIVLEYARKELDDVEIVIPEGWTLDAASAPKAVDSSPFINSRYGLRFRPKSRTLGYQRECVVGNGALSFRQESYPALRTLFAAIHEADQHGIMIKPKPAPAPEASAPAAPATPATPSTAGGASE